MALIQITAYLRDEEDLKLWKELGNKTEFLHDALGNNQNNSRSLDKHVERVRKIIADLEV